MDKCKTGACPDVGEWKTIRLYIHKSVLDNPSMLKKVPETNFYFIETVAPSGFMELNTPELILATGAARETEYEIIGSLYDLDEDYFIDYDSEESET